MSQLDSQRSPEKPKLLNATTIGVVVSVGCLTLVIVIIALLLGIWLDGQFNTRPWFTLGLIILSIPVSLFVIVAIVRKAILKIRSDLGNTKDQPTEVAGFGKKT